MKKRKKRIGGNFKSSANQQMSRPNIVEMEPEELAGYVRRAETQTIPTIKEKKMGPGAAQLLLALHTQMLVTGNPSLTTESGMSIANTILSLWQAGYYTPGPAYPYTLEETLQDIQQGLKARGDYADFFQPFLPTKKDTPRGLGQMAGGIVKHPETQLWQIWIILDGPCHYIGAYRDPVTAQKSLEELIVMSRRGGTEADSLALYLKLNARGIGKPKQLPHDMMLHLLEHLERFTIKL
jgi:hypothetical protein